MAGVASASCVCAAMEVRLNVYDLPGSETSNAFLYSIGMGGLYHTGIEVCNTAATPSGSSSFEYSFSSSGIQRSACRLPEFGHLRTQVLLGVVPGMPSINNAVAELSQREFAPGTYHLTSHNCNHFTEAFSQALFERSIPSYINRAAAAASTVIPQQQAAAEGASDSLAAPGNVKPPKEMRVVANAEAKSVRASSAMFSFFTTTRSGGGDGQQQRTKPTEHKQLSEKQKALLAKLKH